LGFALPSVVVDRLPLKVEKAYVVRVPPGWTPSPKKPEAVLANSSNSPALSQWAIAAAKRAVENMMKMALAKKMPASNNNAAAAPTPPVEVKREPIPSAPANVPFAHDPMKQQRYQNWLLGQNGLSLVWKNAGAPSATELAEFEEVKNKWVAVPAGMADRFAPSGYVASDVKKEEEHQAEEFRKYGPGTTRTEEEWAPTSLLCRRWGVKDPYAGARIRPDGGKPTSGPVKGEDLFPALTRELEKQFGASYRAQMEVAEAMAKEKAEAEAEAAKLLNPSEEITPVVRPSKDVFSAIFESGKPAVVVVAPDPVVSICPDVINVDKAPASKKREPVRLDGGVVEDYRGLSSIFGLDPEDDGRSSKKSKTLELLEKSSVLSEWVKKEAKDKKKKKKKDSKKKKKKKKKEHK
jgi:hypothetical protein